MKLYSGSSQQFIQDTVQNQIAEKLRLAFFDYYRFYPSPGEINAWRNSLRAVKDIFEMADLYDHGVMLEYQLPLSSKRLDCLICGKNKVKADNAVIIELKQWEKCNEAEGANELSTYVGGSVREVLHPSAQVGQYKMYLEDTHTAFYEGPHPVKLHACSYLHNYNFYKTDAIFDEKFSKLLRDFPLFTADDTAKFKDYLVWKLDEGEGLETLKKIEKSKYRPSKKLMDHVGNIIKGNANYILLDEQQIVYDKVLALVKSGFHDKQKTVLIVKGGPGTGKSIIALNLMADLLLNGYNAHYATGSKAFTETLWEIIGRRGSAQFKYFNSYVAAERNAIDVLICDESHRIRVNSNNRFTPQARRSKLFQIEEILRASKVAVFLIDDKQIVRPNEIGSSDYIEEFSNKHKCQLFTYELGIQFRCNGSEAFINWINNTLQIERTANAIWDLHEEFDFRIFESPYDLENAIKQKSAEGHTARLTAGFCWKWSKPEKDGNLVNDVVIDTFQRPWNAKPDAGKLALGIPKASVWAYDPNGINQIGCIYTAQGFEFDYVGVIFGTDLAYNFDLQKWEGRFEYSQDTVVKKAKREFLDLVKNTYRVLLTRGMKGCYVYFMDKDTERFFKSRIEKDLAREKGKVLMYSDFIEENVISGHGRIISTIDQEAKFKDYLPVYSLKAAAGKFGMGSDVHEEGWMLVSIGKKLNKDMFIAQVKGHSMEPLIPNNSYCVFKTKVLGSRQGRIVLVQHHGIYDIDTRNSYTVKKYRSKKQINDDGIWQHEQIILESLNKQYEPIILLSHTEDEFRVIAEFIAVV
ncbi:MAG: DUF2075 domain-containing protein [Betaproteobacteria bacterium]|nr:DUF2075 domain-containing protein [Betaproteobacteria bacterium]